MNQLIVQNLYLHVECFHPLGEDGSEGLWHILRSPNGLRDCRQRWRRGIWRSCSISKRASDGDKKTGRTAVWIGRSCDLSLCAAVCRIFATLRGIVKRLLRTCHACNRSNGWNSTQIGDYEVHVYDFIVVDFTHSYCVDCQSVLSSNM